ncbi:glycoside hydrolase family 76 protein [Paenarthrobacter aurescens]|uniref:Glycoside hydrolase n=1 Tax=Paenarthrobacter aurescens TaxID=43663 RepID=A0A4Y3NJN1_PAEAU|nr:glycoside hydrolase family 76 protein [Paenarthrobacter aurescens]MDO6142362.1 glycosyl hydrolase [Paenarthrobacter aurescens]MDO6146209.1 glycosyl hydrolase [Paenarthrobacter aurescens]MDO6157454.1 glycosyl hydrolase [Paenarthrobacter aurescens]MDO6161439.1 glycosyl hydrolase [Paenarthrobacter aurescens]GEB18919.1 glycoside hydrolase [Paenarthrobacter aurescens]
MSSQIQPNGTPAPTKDAAEWAARANQAARSVTRSFGRRFLFLPGTHIGAVSLPSSSLKSLSGPWHYWWQAHYVDCLVDAGRRELAGKTKFDGGSRPSAGRLASRLVTTIRLRNLLRFVNDYYDDMAWLALATLRLEKLAEETRKPGRRRNAYVQKSLTLQFDSASTDDFGGGTFWSTKRDFKNTPATAPVALYYARTGHTERAQQLVNWLNSKLLHPERGIYQDGVRIKEGGLAVDTAIYTYNQGPVLGALLELGGEDNLRRADLLVDAVKRELTLPGMEVIRGEGTGDGGLFTGILLRYLALAARDGRLPAPTRDTAKSLVHSTAEAFWAGRRVNTGNPSRGTPAIVFSFDPQRPAAETYPAGAAVELSTQLQAWMALEAAATL